MLIIFDLDGTLLNTIKDLSNAVNHALKARGWPPRTEQECLQFVGNGISKLLERSLPREHQIPTEVAALRPIFVSYYNAHLADYTTPYPGIEKTLCALQARGEKLAVLSNKYQEATEKIVSHFFPKISFVAVLGQQENVPTKPNPTAVEKILRLTNIPKEQCVYVGDSDVDMQTARNAGVCACAVTWGFRSRETLAAFAPKYIIERPEELIQIS